MPAKAIATAAGAAVFLSTALTGCATTPSKAQEPATPAAATPSGIRGTAMASPTSPEPASPSLPPVQDALLPVSLLPRPPGFAPWSLRTGNQGPSLISPAQCAVSASAVTDAGHQRRDYVGPAGQAAAEVAARFPDEAAAVRAFALLREQTSRCTSSHPQVTDRPGIGNQTTLLVAATREPSPQAPDVLAVGVVRTGRLVSLLVIQVPGRTAPQVAVFDPFLKAVARHSAASGR